MNAGVGFKGEIVFPDSARSKELLKKKLLPEKGFAATTQWAAEFLGADTAMKAGWSIVADENHIQLCLQAMQTAKNEFQEECRIFIEKFETQASNMVDAMLINAEDQIKKEKEKLGLKSETTHEEYGSTTTHTAENKAYLAEAKTAAGDLAKRRSLADFRKTKATEARKKREMAQANAIPIPGVTDGPMFDPNKPPQPLAGIPGAVIGLDEYEQGQKDWKDAEKDFKEKAHAATAKYTSLGPYLMGGGDIADRLKQFAEETPARSEHRLGEDFAEKLTNIQKVRSEFGGRYSIWKQPMIVSMMHQKMASDKGDQRLVTDKVTGITEDAKRSQELYAALALGVGLLAAIPTGGSSVLAGVALAAAVTGAGMSAYHAYEESQEYLLGSAAANTSLDRANQISQDEPSLLFLAIDIAGAIADVAGARVAFVALKEAIAVAKAAKSLEALPGVMRSMRSAHISGANQGKVIAEVLPSGGDIGKALHDIRQVFIKTAEGAADQETAILMKQVAEKAMNEGKVIVVPSTKEEAKAVIRFRLEAKGFKGETLDEEVMSAVDELFNGATNGYYNRVDKLIFLKGDMTAEGAASVLIHEMTHAGQDAKNILNKLGTYHSEFEAFKAQQQFLGLLPSDKVPDDFIWLLKATDSDIEKHVLTAYAELGAVKPTGLSNSDMAATMYSSLFGG